MEINLKNDQMQILQMSEEILGIACVYGITISKAELIDILGIEDTEDMDVIKKSLETGMSVYTHPDWDEMIILGSTIVVLDVDPSLEGSKLAPVITIPDIFDFRKYSEEQPLYYQIPILKNNF
jgi:hypothetical protein